MRLSTPHPANPVRLTALAAGIWRTAFPPLRRGDTRPAAVAPALPTTAEGLAQAVLTAPAFTFPTAPDAVLESDPLLALYRRAIAQYDDCSGYSPRDIERREDELRRRLDIAWGDLQGAARRFLAVTEKHEAGR